LNQALDPSKGHSVAISAPSFSSLGSFAVGGMSERGDEEPHDFSQITIISCRVLLREVGTVSDWCMRYGRMCGHPANLYEKVARIINLGVARADPLPPEVLRDVPEATTGSWWISEATIDSHHLETYQRLARHAEEFREGIWTRARQERRAKYVLDMVEWEMKLFRLRLCVMQMEREPVGNHGMDPGGGRSDEGADNGLDAAQERT